MTMHRIGRRLFLKGAGGVSLGLPLFTSWPAHGQTMNFPKRFIVFFHPNGTIPDAWFPTPGATERDFTMSEILQPLEPHRQKLILLDGVHMQAPDAGPGEPHQQGMGALLTGKRLQEGTFVGGDGSLAGWGDGESVDQLIASYISQGTRFASIQFGVRATGAAVRHRLSYAGPARPLPPQNAPRAVFGNLFRDFMVEPDERERQRLRRKSILDAVRGQFAHVRTKVSVADRDKLDTHLEFVRDIERRLDLMGPTTPRCEVPSEPPQLDAVHEDNMGTVSRLQTDLLVAAMACDLTRVASIQYSTGANNIRFSFMGSYTDDHQLSHAGNGDATSRSEWIARQRWYAEQFKYLLDRLDAIPEGSGTMLDNTVIFWGSELAVGNTHSHVNMPFLLAGRAGGQLDTGRYVRFPSGRQHNDLHVALLNLMGIAETTFGDPDFCNGALPGLT